MPKEAADGEAELERDRTNALFWAGLTIPGCCEGGFVGIIVMPFIVSATIAAIL